MPAPAIAPGIADIAPSQATTVERVPSWKRGELIFLAQSRSPTEMSSKGPSGSTTTTTNNTPWNSGYLSDVYNTGRSLYNNNPVEYTPNQTLATPDPNITNGYNDYIWQGNNIGKTLQPAADSTLTTAMGGGYGVTNSPAYGALNTNTGSGQTNAVRALSNPALQPLTDAANGKYLGSNPYLDSEYAAATRPTVNAYETATAPTTDSNYELAGRYGSGAHENAQAQNKTILGTALGDEGASLYGKDYANERGLMTTAASDLGSTYTGGINASTGALGQADTAANDLQTGYDTGNKNTLYGLGLYPSTATADTTGAKDVLTGGLGLTGLSQSNLNDVNNRFYGNEMAPWTTADMFSNLEGNPVSGTSSTTTPYFTNPASTALGTGLGGLSLYNGINSATSGTSAGGLFGSQGPLLGTAADASIASGGPPLAAGGGKGAKAAAPAALA